MKIIETRIDRFDGGWTNDPREEAPTKASAVGHFDIFTRPKRLTPFRDMESADADAANNFITQFVGYNSKVYGFGTASGGSTPKIWERADFTGATWTASAVAGAGTRYPYIFIEQGGGGFMWETVVPEMQSIDFGGVLTPGAHFAGGTFTGATFFGQPCVHSKDKKVYLPWNNKIARVEYGVLNESAVLTVPASLQIPCVSEYGNFLAIAVRPTTGRITNSACYLWDRDSTLATLTETYDLGSEAVQILDVVGGELIAISANINVTSANLFPKVVFRRFNGQGFEVFQELEASAIIGAQVMQREKFNNRLYFNLIITIEGTAYAGIWSLGRSAPGQPISLNLDYIVDPVNTATVIYGFRHINDYLFASYHYGSTEALSKTNDAASYTTTSFWESPIQAIGDASQTKKLLGITVTHGPLPAAGQVIVKYKKDAETSYTTILTNTTDDSISKSAINIESSGINLPEFKEIRFRIESTGGAAITGLNFQSEIIPKKLYS